MAKRTIHDVLDGSALPLLIVLLVPLGVVLFLIFGANSNAQQPAATAPAQQTQTTAQTPPPAANISLDDPSSLPTSVTAAELVPFSFSVQNPSDVSATYQYKVTVHWSTGEDDVIDENTIALAAGASTTIDEQLKFEIATETADVSFQLPQTDQSVQFTLPAKQ